LKSSNKYRKIATAPCWNFLVCGAMRGGKGFLRSNFENEGFRVTFRKQEALWTDYRS
jgi:hypothetical protein